MKQFLKIIFGSCLGVLLAFGAFVFIVSAVAGRMVAKENAAVTVKPNSVLELNFDKPIPEKTNNVPVDPMAFDTESTLGLHDMAAAIESASEDDNIKGILLDLSAVSSGQASASVLRRALEDFRETGKFVHAYSKGYSQGAYYMASLADKIYVHPTSGIDFRGFSRQIPFFKNMLDKLGVKMQIYYAGKFKSATEPFRLEKMSEESRLQSKEYIDEMYRIFLEDISKSRGISVPELRRIADEYLIREPEDAVKYKLADEIGYYDQVIAGLKSNIGLEEDDKLKLVGIGSYAKGRKKKSNYKIKDQIAVVIAEGEIQDGEGKPGIITDDKYTKIIRKIRKNDKVKAIVLRVNSPGGSGLASENIWRELILAKEAGKPVVVSMGDLAASGGYYISCMADSIFAEPNTITGSIGVFGMIPSIEQMLDDKVGVKFDTVKTSKYATGISPFMDINPEEGEIIQGMVEDFYEIFLKRVADGRGMSRDAVHEVAQGRVWTGTKAKTLGLVDRLGGLDDAIACAGRLAELEEYRTKEYPVTKDRFQQIIEEFTKKNEAYHSYVKSEMKEMYPLYKEIKELQEMKGVQARLPFFDARAW